MFRGKNIYINLERRLTSSPKTGILMMPSNQNFPLNNMITHTTHSDQETKNFAKNFAARLKGGDIICLHGNLGAGKTTFVQGLAEGLGITNDITSPTFTLMNLYPVSPTKFVFSKLVHIDTYRLEGAQELLDIGSEDYLGQKDTVTIIEWPEKIASLLSNKKTIDITIENQGAANRNITVAE